MRANKNIPLVILLFLVGICILYPYHNFQISLAQGDNGRDLYCFRQTLEGKIPYRDYWWVYGPLMPYYYSFFYKLFGINIQSILVGKIALQLVCGIFVFLICSSFAARSLATIAALWFWAFSPDFAYTYNHIGGIMLLFSIIYFIFQYIKEPRVVWIIFSFISVFILGFIKINVGIFNLIAVLICFLALGVWQKNLTGQKRNLLICGALVIPGVTFLIYALLFHGLPAHYVGQCLPYLKSNYHYYTSPLIAIKTLGQIYVSHLFSNRFNLLFGIIIILSAVKVLQMFTSSKSDKNLKNNITTVLFTLCLFFVVNCHEFIASGIPYQVYWTTPFTILMIFFVLSQAIADFPKTISRLLYGTLVIIVFLNVCGTWGIIQSYKISRRYLDFPTAKIYCANSPEWISTVTETSDYLKGVLKNGEMFFALPYEPLYYFLLERNSPTRELIFFDHLNIAEEQEHDIIRQLEDKNVNFILISSRISSPTKGLGTFGKTYCPVLSKYFDDHFQAVASFGDWQTPPTISWEHHGTKILKRVVR